MRRGRDEMVEMIQRGHEQQSRNAGRVPYWLHLVAGAQLLEWAMDTSRERPTDDLREDLFIAALGRDLYEHTAVQPDDVRLRWGDRVERWIRELTNVGDHRTEASTIAAGSEEARLIALASWTESTTHAGYAIHDHGITWTRDAFLPLVTEVHDALRAGPFPTYPRTSARLHAHLDFACELLRRNLALFELADELPRQPPPVRQPGTDTRPPELTEEQRQRALERTREREHEAGERSPGRVLRVPDRDD